MAFAMKTLDATLYSTGIGCSLALGAFIPALIVLVLMEQLLMGLGMYEWVDSIVFREKQLTTQGQHIAWAATLVFLVIVFACAAFALNAVSKRNGLRLLIPVMGIVYVGCLVFCGAAALYLLSKIYVCC
jgi:hypothetical protein